MLVERSNGTSHLEAAANSANTQAWRKERLMRRRLTEIANDAGTDKGTEHGDAQGYTLIYEILFEPMRDRALNLLEAGLSIGGPEHGMPASRQVSDAPSVRMWKEYFPHARIFGLDISDFSAFEADRFKFYRADCGDAKQLDNVVAELSRSGVFLDIIVDDASHASFHQQLTMLKLFPLLKAGGLYIIEDLHWQPKSYEGHLPKVPKTGTLFAELLENGRFVNTGSISEKDWQTVLTQIGSTILLDQDYLLHLSHGHNVRSPTWPPRASSKDISWPKRLLNRKGARRIYEQMRAMTQVFSTGVAPICSGRIALAIIQKL